MALDLGQGGAHLPGQQGRRLCPAGLGAHGALMVSVSGCATRPVCFSWSRCFILGQP